jgi:hypothetical protein
MVATSVDIILQLILLRHREKFCPYLERGLDIFNYGMTLEIKIAESLKKEGIKKKVD